jgi:hypothetical protein
MALETFVHREKANARTLTRARILLKSAESWSSEDLTNTFDVCRAVTHMLSFSPLDDTLRNISIAH